MRSYWIWFLVCLLVLATAGLLYVLIMWPPDSTGQIGPAPSEEVHAHGRLELVGRFGAVAGNLDWHQVGEVLTRQNVAPVARGVYFVPEEILIQEPSKDAGTPAVPKLSQELQNHRPDLFEEVAQVAGSGLSAALYGSHGAFGPCVLLITSGLRSPTVQRQLHKALGFSDARMVIYAKGSGLLVFVSGFVQDSGDSFLGKSWQGIYLAEAPKWEPRLLVDPER